jgi:preprotein translocase subunit SecD
MRKFNFMFSISVALLCGCGASHSESTNTALKFYIVSQEKTDGARFIDTPELPKVGYISVRPDLVVTNVKDVFPEKSADYAIMRDTNGMRTVVPSHPAPALSVKLQPEDGKLFASLTRQAVGKRVLVMLDEKPLTAPTVKFPIESGAFLIEFRDESDLKKTGDVLKRLIRQ